MIAIGFRTVLSAVLDGELAGTRLAVVAVESAPCRPARHHPAVVYLGRLKFYSKVLSKKLLIRLDPSLLPHANSNVLR